MLFRSKYHPTRNEVYGKAGLRSMHVLLSLSRPSPFFSSSPNVVRLMTRMASPPPNTPSPAASSSAHVQDKTERYTRCYRCKAPFALKEGQLLPDILRTIQEHLAQCEHPERSVAVAQLSSPSYLPRTQCVCDSLQLTVTGFPYPIVVIILIRLQLKTSHTLSIFSCPFSLAGTGRRRMSVGGALRKIPTLTTSRHTPSPVLVAIVQSD